MSGEGTTSLPVGSLFRRGNTRNSFVAYASAMQHRNEHDDAGAKPIPAVGPFPAFEPGYIDRGRPEPLNLRRGSGQTHRSSLVRTEPGSNQNTVMPLFRRGASLASDTPSFVHFRRQVSSAFSTTPDVRELEPMSARSRKSRDPNMFDSHSHHNPLEDHGPIREGSAPTSQKSSTSRMGSLVSLENTAASLANVSGPQHSSCNASQITSTVDGGHEVVTSFALEVWLFLNDADSSFAARIYFSVMRYIILASVVLPLLQSADDPIIKTTIGEILEWGFDIIFFAEVLLRLSVTAQPLRFLTSPFNVIDTLAAVPLLLRVILLLVDDGAHNDEFIDSVYLNIVPVPRLLKILRTFQQFHLLLSAFKIAFEALPILLYTLFAILLASSVCIFVVEPRWNIPTLPHSMYFCVITMTTVGYGDLTPTTGGGRFCAGVLVVCGILYMAMPIGIIGSAFQEVWRERDRILLMQRMHERLLYWGYSAEDIPDLMYTFDTRKQGDLKGDLNFQDFSAMVRKMGIVIGEDRAYKLFTTLDIDESGAVSAAEMVRSLFPSAYKDMYLHETEAMASQRSIYRSAGVSNIFVNKRGSMDATADDKRRSFVSNFQTGDNPPSFTLEEDIMRGEESAPNKQGFGAIQEEDGIVSPAHDTARSTAFEV
eukprot:CAMPEP_0178373394 /NCGR_PEP_ID=MMETSP0689_2-20121128/1840_1 /TAXON_ID=160604 /ORGANISM="Amphidinium massartii, Strain CS-259" /LENGTH=652 /DNA_ID=CAMNT_0019993335 /DNA_START=435 /DNA_END=2393 /DNA_ORIENTATION=+